MSQQSVTQTRHRAEPRPAPAGGAQERSRAGFVRVMRPPLKGSAVMSAVTEVTHTDSQPTPYIGWRILVPLDETPQARRALV